MLLCGIGQPALGERDQQEQVCPILELSYDDGLLAEPRAHMLAVAADEELELELIEGGLGRGSGVGLARARDRRLDGLTSANVSWLRLGLRRVVITKTSW